MFPILYDTITEGTVPSHNGLGVLSDCLRCEVTEERNGAYELSLDYTANGIHASDIAVNKFIMAKPNFTDDPQIFRIYKVGKTINGQFTVSAQHISYDLSGKVITSGTAADIVSACLLLEGQVGSFTINTDKVTVGSFKITAPSSVRSWFGGKEGSLLDVYGSGEWKYDNYTASLKANRGQDRGVTIRYGKNLTELSQELDMSNLCTAVVPFYINQDGVVTVGAEVTTGLVLDVDRKLAVDFSDTVNPDSATPIATQLANLANAYVTNNNLTNVLNSITLNFVQSGELTERVDLCDTVAIYFEALGISASAKCVACTWDVLHNRYSSTTFGNAKTNIADTIAATQKEASEAVNKSYMDIAISHATEMITGNLGGYVVLHDTDSDGVPDEILIMNTADITTATKVWRWNKNGLGYSDQGYAGPYGLAMTADGEIVADYITTGTLNAGLIKAGVLQDFQGNSSINMTTGEANLKDMKAKNSFTLIDSSSNVRAQIGYSVGDGTFFRAINGSGDTVASIDATSAGNGLIAMSDNAQHRIVTLQKGSYSGELWLGDFNNNTRIYIGGQSAGSALKLRDTSGNDRAQLYVDANGGELELTDSSGNTHSSMTRTSSGGRVLINDTSGALRGNLAVDSNGGQFFLENTSDVITIALANDANGNGRIYITEAGGQQIVTLEKATDGGKVTVKNDYGTTLITLGATSEGSELLIKNHSSTNSVRAFTGGAGDGTVNVYNSSGTAQINLAGESGQVTCVNVVQTSSRKVKENIKPIEDARKILELEAVSFDYKNKALGEDRRGFIAEDVAEILPNLVKPETDEAPASLDYIQMIPYLQEIIKEQDKRIKALEDKINGSN